MLFYAQHDAAVVQRMLGIPVDDTSMPSIQPNSPWESLDFKLIEAYQIMQDEICPNCGQPVWLCRSDDERILWKVDNDVCYATRALEEQRWERDNAGKKKDQKTKKDMKNWGRIDYPVAWSPEHLGGILPGRADYYKRRNGRIET